MDEPNEAVDVEDDDSPMIESTLLDVDLDAETEESAESADEAPAGTDEAPQDSDEHDTPEESDAETPSTEPFSFTAYGTKFDVPGAVVQELDDGKGGTEAWIAMPKSAFQESVQPHLLDRSAVRSSEESYKRQIRELDPTKNPAVVEAGALLEGWKAVMDMEPDDRAAWMEDGAANMERLKLESENKALRETREERTAVTEEQDYSELTEHLQTDLPLQVEIAMERLGVTLPASVMKEVSDHLWARVQNGERIYVQGEEWSLGAGEIGVQNDLIDEAVNLFVNSREAGAKKAERANEPKKVAPRAVSAKGSPAPAGKDKEYASKEEWEADMGLGN